MRRAQRGLEAISKCSGLHLSGSLWKRWTGTIKFFIQTEENFLKEKGTGPSVNMEKAIPQAGRTPGGELPYFVESLCVRSQDGGRKSWTQLAKQALPRAAVPMQSPQRVPVSRSTWNNVGHEHFRGTDNRQWNETWGWDWAVIIAKRAFFILWPHVPGTLCELAH